MARRASWTVVSLAAVMALALPAGAFGAPIAVNTTGDSVVANDGKCSLREAITSANTDTAFGGCAKGNGTDAITLGVGTFAVTRDGARENDNASGDLDVKSNLTIGGAGASNTRIDASGIPGEHDRVLDIKSGTVTIQGVTIRGGRAPDGGKGADQTGSAGGGSVVGGDGAPGSGGGGIANFGTLTVASSLIEFNVGGTGGAGGTGTGGAGNSQGRGGDGSGGRGGIGGSGGGIYNGGTLTVTNTVVDNDDAGSGGDGGAGKGGGGGVAAGGVGSGGDGGNGFGAEGGVGGHGAGIYNAGTFFTAVTLEVTNSTVSRGATGTGGSGGTGSGGDAGGGGPAGAAGAGLGGSGGNSGDGGGLAGRGDLTLAGSTLAFNRTSSGGQGGTGAGGATEGGNGKGTGGQGGDGGDGGGMEGVASTRTANNTTIVGNQGGQGGFGGNALGGVRFAGKGGTGGSGGGVFSDSGGTLGLVHVTIASNATGVGGVGGGAGNAVGADGSPGSGGAVRDLAGTASAANTIISGDCDGGPADAGGNLATQPFICPGTPGDPKLGPLQDNGGPTQTMALGTGSDAIDKIPATGAGCTKTDQRGAPRPFGLKCDIGAFEAGATVPSAATGGSTGARPVLVAGKVSDHTAPTGQVTVDPETFAVGSQPTPITASSPRRSMPKGTTIGYRLSEAASVALSIEQKAPGLKLRRGKAKTGCLAATRRNRRALVKQLTRALGRRATGPSGRRRLAARVRRSSCVLYASRGMLHRSGTGGSNKLPFSGRIGSKALRAGRYRVVLVATDAAGNRSSPANDGFRVVAAVKNKRSR